MSRAYDDTRERWLEAASELLRVDFQRAGTPLPDRVRVSIGFPSRSAMAARKQRIGECWDAKATHDGIAQVFITPLIEDSVKVLDVLTHELCHAAVGSKAGHKGPFVTLAKAMGLTGKMTATVAGPELLIRLNNIIDVIGPIPHSKLNPSAKDDKKQTTRLIKAECANDEYIVRLSRKTLAMGLPICPVCERHMIAEGEADENEEN